MAVCDDTGVSIWSDTLSSSSSGQRNYRVVITSSDTSDPGCTPTQVRVKVKASTGTLDINGTSIGERNGSTIEFNGSPTRLLWSGSNSTTLTAIEEAWTDWADFVVDPDTDYLIHLTCNDASDTSIVGKSKVNGCYRKFTSDDDTLVVSPTGYSLVSFIYGVIDIEVRGPSSSSTTTTTTVTTTTSTTTTFTTTTTVTTTTSTTSTTTTTTAPPSGENKNTVIAIMAMC